MRAKIEVVQAKAGSKIIKIRIRKKKITIKGSKDKLRRLNILLKNWKKQRNSKISVEQSIYFSTIRKALILDPPNITKVHRNKVLKPRI